MLKGTESRCSAGKTSDDGMRNKGQHEDKGKGWACNNHNMRDPSLHLLMGLCMLLLLPSYLKLLMLHDIFSCLTA